MYFQYSVCIFCLTVLRSFRKAVQSESRWNSLALFYSLCFLFSISLISFEIQGSENLRDDNFEGMYFFMISWSLVLKRFQSGSGESVSGAWFWISSPRSWSSFSMCSHSAFWYLYILCGGGLSRGSLTLMFSRGMLSWSLMPGMLCVLSMREELVVRKSSRMFCPLVGSLTAWCRCKSLVRSSRSGAVLSLSGHVRFFQSILGQLKSPAIQMLWEPVWLILLTEFLSWVNPLSSVGDP